MAKVGKGTKSVGPISTPFVDHCVPKPGQAGHGVAVHDGVDIAGGAKGTPGVISEVTLVDIAGGAAGTKASGKKIANRS